jgi:hypothetical protein
VVPVTDLFTWRTEGGDGFEGTRVLLAQGGFRALGRLVRSDPDTPFTASYRLVVAEDGSVSRVSVTSATAERERHLTLNRTEDGYWLLDTGSGGTREQFANAVDVDLSHSPMFNSLPVRRLGLHREPGAHTLSMVYVSLPGLGVELVEQRYRTVRPLDESGTAVVEFGWGEYLTDLVVDADGIVVSYPGLASRVPTTAPASG